MLRGFLMALAGAALSFGTTPVFAAPETAIKTGNDLLAACRDTGWNNGYCSGYILGVYRGIKTYDSVKNTRTFCGDDNGTVEQAVLVVQQYMTSHAKVMSQSSEWAVIAALMDAFPCSTS